MLSYNHNEIDQRLVAADGLTGGFREEYTTLVEGHRARGEAEKADHAGRAVVSSIRTDAVVLAFVHRITTSAEVLPAASTGGGVRMGDAPGR